MLIIIIIIIGYKALCYIDKDANGKIIYESGENTAWLSVPSKRGNEENGDSLTRGSSF